VVCTLKEKHHDNFQQVGDELHAVISVPTMKAKSGCPIAISLLDSDINRSFRRIRRSSEVGYTVFFGVLWLPITIVKQSVSACEAKVATYRSCCSC